MSNDGNNIGTGRRLVRAVEDGVVIEVATPADDAALRQLLRQQSMPGWVRLSMQREPSYFVAAAIEGDRHSTVVAREAATGMLLGMGSRSVRTVFVDGRPRRLGYLGQFRRHPSRRRSIKLLIEAFRFCRGLRGPEELPYDLTAILADNAAALRLFTGGLRGMPRYTAVDRLTTLIFPARAARWPRGEPHAEAAGPDDIPRIATHLQNIHSRHQFAPVWTADDLRCPVRCPALAAGDFQVVREGGDVLGCAALWDQRSFRQIVVEGYSRPLAVLRPAINLGAALLGYPKLPRPRSPLKLAYVSHVAVENDDPAIFAALLRGVAGSAGSRGVELLAIGMSNGNPLLRVVGRMYPCRRIESVLCLVHDEGDAPCRPLDGRMAHPEIAVL